MGLWDKIKDYVGIGLTKTKGVRTTLKKAGRESETDLHQAASKVARSSVKKKKK